MCLRKLNKPEKKAGFGWKKFVKHNGKLYSTFCAPNAERKNPRLIDKWLKANKTTIQKYGISYESGWHILKTKIDAQRTGVGADEVLRKVEYKQSNYEGPVKWYDSMIITDCIVANQMKILDE